MKLVKETRKIWVSIETISFTLFLISYMLSRDLFKFPLVGGRTSVVYKMNLPFFFFFFQNDMNVKVTATCVRVPVMRAHAESVNLQFENPLDEVVLRSS